MRNLCKKRRKKRDRIDVEGNVHVVRARRVAHNGGRPDRVVVGVLCAAGIVDAAALPRLRGTGFEAEEVPRVRLITRIGHNVGLQEAAALSMSHGAGGTGGAELEICA